MKFQEEQVALKRQGKKALRLALVLTFVFMLAEFAGGIASGSLALMADAGHMLTDVVALSFALFAFWMSDRPPTQRMSYGFHRAEIIAALANGVILFNMVFYLLAEAVKRLASPPPVASGVMFFFALAGLAVNVTSAAILRRAQYGNLNLQGALFHVLSDLLGSLGVLSAAVSVRIFHWPYADPLAGLVIGFLVACSAWKLLAGSVSILLEAAPRHVDLEALERSFKTVPGVRDVHDLHVWTISSGKEALSAHLEIEKEAVPDEILRKVNFFLEQDFRIFHSTIQLETTSFPEHQASF